jgi:DNA-binding response OmpR family regulator
VTFPVRTAEFRERVTSLLRRAYPERFGVSSFDVGPYHFDTERRPLSLVQQGLFKTCSKFVQNSRRRNLHFQWLKAARICVDRGRSIAHVA